MSTPGEIQRAPSVGRSARARLPHPRSVDIGRRVTRRRCVRQRPIQHGPQIEVRGRGSLPGISQPEAVMARTQNRQPVNAEDALERLRRLSLGETSMEALLQAVAEVAKQVMPGEPETSVSVLVGRVPTTVVSTGALAHDCDESQYKLRNGPRLDASTSGELTGMADAVAEPRWRDYVQEAAERGVLSSLSVPLPIGKGSSAALNIYARTANAFDEDSRSVALRL